MKKRKLVCGVGINDSDYNVYKYDENHKIILVCPFYRAWVNMLQRCYSEKYQLKKPTYKGCTVCETWHRFMVFRSWMVQQECEGNTLDKDLKVIGNKVYSPDTCMFVSQSVNSFTVDSGAKRGKYPIGVCKQGNRYQSRINDLTGKTIHLGIFSTPEEAYEAWRYKKLELAYKLQSQQDRLEVRQGIQNYIDHILIKDYYLHQWLRSKGKTRHPTNQTAQ